jgi:anaerobic nitric oxide reductase flavorubredoxin
MRSAPVSDGITWVGAIDWNLRDFHGYETPGGTTYNAYLVTGAEKTALVDTVKSPFVPELLDRIRSVVELESIDYIVVNHIEPDHNSGLSAVASMLPQAKIVASPGGTRAVVGYHPDIKVEAVGADDVIDLGGKTLRFLPVPMVHWPDSMFTYCPESHTLMPNDAFGQHLASSERFADQLGVELAIEEMIEYYANILMPLGAQVSKALGKVIELGWVCDTIAPSHGVAWRGEDVAAVVDQLSRLAAGETHEKLVIAYTTMWGSTDLLARAIADGASEGGVHVEMHELAVTAFSRITRELIDSRALLLGSPALHHEMHYRTAGYLQYIAGLKPPNKLGGVFGSYGWSSGATKQMSARLAEIGFELPLAEITCKFKPTGDDLDRAREWGTQFAQLVRERSGDVETMAPSCGTD